MPTTIVMPSVDEDEESFTHSRGNSQASVYPPMSSSSNDMPLLQNNDDSAASSRQILWSQDEIMPPRRSMDTVDSTETSSLMRVSSGSPIMGADPRGAAPPYFEVVDATAHTNTSSSGARTSPGSTSPPPEQGSPRRSVFRSLLHAMNLTHGHTSGSTLRGESYSSDSHRHNRAQSAASAISSNDPDRPQNRPTHRPSHSDSGSFLGFSGFRALSQPRSASSTNNAEPLNSPSLITLDSISSPLPHTLVRTEFTYPKSGPTPEQLKLISSRETFARFGMPYGPAAIAYASSSRQNLEAPPPDFDTTLGSGDSSPRVGLSHPRTSDASDNLPVETLESTGPSLSPHSAPAPPSPARIAQPPSLSPPAVAQVPFAARPSLSSATNIAQETSPPPASFRLSSITPARSESRSTTYSMQSYVTAAEFPIASAHTPESESHFSSARRFPPARATSVGSSQA
jgi:hypothetical protein